jgi:hypothetical protein
MCMVVATVSKDDYAKRCEMQRIEREELVIMAIRENGPTTVKDLAGLIGCTTAQAYVTIYALEDAGKTQRTDEFPARCFISKPDHEVGAEVLTIHGEPVVVVGHTPKKVRVRHPGGGASARYSEHLRNAPESAAVAQAMSERVSNWPETGITKRVGNEIIVSCSGCTETARFGGRMPAAQIRIQCERDSWTIDKKWKQSRCKACAGKENQMNKAIPVPAKRPSLRVLMSLLEEHYCTEANQYDEGWTDERISKDADCSVAYVAEIREREFGPLEDPRIADLRVAINVARSDAKAEAAEIRSLADDVDRKWAARLDDLGTRLNALLKPR